MIWVKNVSLSDAGQYSGIVIDDRNMNFYELHVISHLKCENNTDNVTCIVEYSSKNLPKIHSQTLGRNFTQKIETDCSSKLIVSVDGPSFNKNGRILLSFPPMKRGVYLRITS